MNLSKRRRTMGSDRYTYLFSSVNPSVDSYGTYLLTPIDAPEANLDSWIISGSTTYNMQGIFSARTIVDLRIDPLSITWATERGTFSQRFAGFPVQFGRPNVSIMYSVSKEE